MRRNFMVEMSLLVLVVIALAFGFVSNREAKEREAELMETIADLEGEIQNWRVAAIPVLRADGVDVQVNELAGMVDGIDPGLLGRASNPCSSHRPADGRPELCSKLGVIMKSNPPIKVVLDEEKINAALASRTP